MVFMPGPIFANIVLADEINRTPPKTQSALLEAMQEHRVTVQGRTYTLEEPFFVFATQNPIELEGTYPLPEAQLDRFMFEIVIDYLPEEEEMQVVQATTSIQEPAPSQHAVTGARDRRVPASRPPRARSADRSRAMRSTLARISRPTSERRARLHQEVGARTAPVVRAAQELVLGGKARALMQGRYHVELRRHPRARRTGAAPPHPLNFHAQSERVTTDQIDRAAGCAPCRRRGSRDVERWMTIELELEGRYRNPGARFLDPVVLARIGNLELLARTVVEGFIDGCTARRTSASRSTSPSIARTCRATTSGASTGGSTRAPIDTTSRSTRPTPTRTSSSSSTSRQSMGFGSAGITKLEYAKFLAACLAYFSQPAARPRRASSRSTTTSSTTCRRRQSICLSCFRRSRVRPQADREASTLRCAR